MFTIYLCTFCGGLLVSPYSTKKSLFTKGKLKFLWYQALRENLHEYSRLLYNSKNVMELAQMQNERLDLIFQLWLDLEHAKFKAVKEVGMKHLVDWVPATEEEIQIWNQLTAPKNYERLKKYFQNYQENMNSVAKKWTEKALKIAQKKISISE